MTKTVLGVMVVAAGLLTAADAPKPAASGDRLQGTWYIVHVNRPGYKGARESLDFDDRKFSLTFDHGIVTSTGDGKTLWQGTYQLDAGGVPGTIDIMRRTGPFKQGIYQQNDDSLTLCLDYPDNPRPKNFNTPNDSRVEVMVFTRLKPGS